MRFITPIFSLIAVLLAISGDHVRDRLRPAGRRGRDPGRQARRPHDRGAATGSSTPDAQGARSRQAAPRPVRDLAREGGPGRFRAPGGRRLGRARGAEADRALARARAARRCWSRLPLAALLAVSSVRRGKRVFSTGHRPALHGRIRDPPILARDPARDPLRGPARVAARGRLRVVPRAFRSSTSSG